MYDLLALAYQRRHHARVHVHDGARGQQPDLHAGRASRKATTPSRITRTSPRSSTCWARIQAFHIGLFGEFLAKLDATPDGDGSLLDNTILLYGSNMSNSNAHDHYPLPNVVVGGGRGRVKGGQHIVAEDHAPMTNLLLTVLTRSTRASRRSATAPARSPSFPRETAACCGRCSRCGVVVACSRRPAAAGAPPLVASRQDRRPCGGAGARARCRGSRQRPRPTARRRCTGQCGRTTSSSSSGCCARGADVNAANRYGVTPLHLAAVNGDAKMLERLLDGGRRRQRHGARTARRC